MRRSRGTRGRNTLRLAPANPASIRRVANGTLLQFPRRDTVLLSTFVNVIEACWPGPFGLAPPVASTTFRRSGYKN